MPGYWKIVFTVALISVSSVQLDGAWAAGTLQLSADSTTLSASKPFQHIVVTDTRSGNLPWTVQALATNLSDGGSHPNSVIRRPPGLQAATRAVAARTLASATGCRTGWS